MLKLMYAALIRTSESWRGIKVTAFERKQCEGIEKEIDGDHDRRQRIAGIKRRFAVCLYP